MKANIHTMGFFISGELKKIDSQFVQIVCANVNVSTMSDLYRFKASVWSLPSGKLSIIVNREDILSIEFIDKED